MEVLFAFAVAFGFSFIGSIPPGTLNLTMIQLGLESKLDAALRFAFAAALIEYPYAWVAIEFKNLITRVPYIEKNLELFVALVMVVFAIFSLWSAGSESKALRAFHNSGFRRGIILSILNPLALPFWVGITAYVESMGWVRLSTGLRLHAYLLGVSVGAFCLLMLCAHLSKRLAPYFSNPTVIRKIPGYTLLVLGVYGLFQYLN